MLAWLGMQAKLDQVPNVQIRHITLIISINLIKLITYLVLWLPSDTQSNPINT